MTTTKDTPVEIVSTGGHSPPVVVFDDIPFAFGKDAEGAEPLIERSYLLGRKIGIQLGLGMATDIAHGCLDEAEKLGKSSDGYRRAIFDISHRLLLKLKENEP